MLTGTDDREIKKLTKHFIKSTNRTALHRQPLKMMSFNIALKKLSYQQPLFPGILQQKNSSVESFQWKYRFSKAQMFMNIVHMSR